MCMIRDQDDCDRFVYPFPLFDMVDLTMEEFGEIDDIDITPRNDQWNYPYNLLPSSDEDESSISAIGFLEHVGDYINLFNIQPNVTQDSSNDINQNTNTPSAPSTETTDNNSDQSSEDREGFELNVPQILLSMSTISNNLYERASAPHD